MPKRKYVSNNQEIDFKIKKAKMLLQGAKNFKKGLHHTWFVPKSVNEEGFVLSYGPKNEILFVLDENEENIHPLEKLKLLFENGFIKKPALNPQARLLEENVQEAVADYLPHFSNTYGNKAGLLKAEDNIKDLDKSDVSFIYVIDSSKNSNLSCIPYAACNTVPKKLRRKFFEDSLLDEEPSDQQGSFYIIPNTCKPNSIVGAFAYEYLANSLEISAETLIVNPYYLGDLNLIKNKLQIKNLKNLDDFNIDFEFNYDNMAEAHDAGSNSVENRYLKIQEKLTDKILKDGFESIPADTALMLNINTIINRTPFSDQQLAKIEAKINISKLASELVEEEKIRARQFELGFKQPNCLIGHLPQLVRYKIYQKLYPLNEQFFLEKVYQEFSISMERIKKILKKTQEKFCQEIMHPNEKESIDLDKASTSGSSSSKEENAVSATSLFFSSLETNPQAEALFQLSIEKRI